MARSNDDAETRASNRQEYPEDRFDRVPRSGRVGAHRVTARPRHVWQYLIVGLLGFALLTTAGVIVVQSIGAGGKNALPTEETQAAQTQSAAAIDPEATVAVLDGTQIPNLGTNVDQTITAEGWGQILFSEKISDDTVQISAVFYRDDADEAAARGLAEKLGGVSTYKTEDYEEFGARLIVLLGADYAGPGLDAATAGEGDPSAESEGDGGADAVAPEEQVEEPAQ